MLDKVRSGLSRHWSVREEYGVLYTGGRVSFLMPSEELLLCWCDETINVIDFSTSAIVSKISGGHDGIFTFAVHPSRALVATAHKSGLLRLWDMESGTPVQLHAVKSHEMAVTVLEWDTTGEFLASGSVDKSVRIWSFENLSKSPFCTHAFKNHPTMVTHLSWKPDFRLVSGCMDGSLGFIDLNRRSCDFAKNHSSAISGLVDLSGVTVSTGNDRVMTVWDNQVAVRTVALYEVVSGIVGGDNLVTVGDSGKLRTWVWTGEKMSKLSEKQVGASGGLIRGHNGLLVIREDGVMNLHGDAPKTLVGDWGSVVDVRANAGKLVVVGETSVWEMELGKKEVTELGPGSVVDISSTGQVLIGRKDAMVELRGVGTGEGHVGAVTAVCFASENVVFSAATDRTIKMWSVEDSSLTCVWTGVAHDSDINAMVLSKDGKTLATGGQDHSLKLWQVLETQLVAVGALTGHRRGVWDIAFHPTEHVVASASADNTIKLWNTDSLECIKTLEGHLASVLKLHFLADGFQLVSSGSDGLIKVWSVKSGDCVVTLGGVVEDAEETEEDEQGHSDKVWALDVVDGLIVSGGADGKVLVWRDDTAEVVAREMAVEESYIVTEQALKTALRKKKYGDVAAFAIQLDHPRRLYLVLEELCRSGMEEELHKVISALTLEQVEKFLLYIRDWNTHAKRSSVAQTVLHSIIRCFSGQLGSISGIDAVVDAILAYTDRHFTRADEMLRQSYLVDFMVAGTFAAEATSSRKRTRSPAPGRAVPVQRTR